MVVVIVVVVVVIIIVRGGGVRVVGEVIVIAVFVLAYLYSC